MIEQPSSSGIGAGVLDQASCPSVPQAKAVSDPETKIAMAYDICEIPIAQSNDQIPSISSLTHTKKPSETNLEKD